MPWADRKLHDCLFRLFCYSASHSVHPVGVSQHVHAHQPKYDEHNHGGHDPHYAHVGFFSVLFILVWHPFLPNLFSTVVVTLLRTGAATLREDLFASAYVNLTEQVVPENFLSVIRTG